MNFDSIPGGGAYRRSADGAPWERLEGPELPDPPPPPPPPDAEDADDG